MGEARPCEAGEQCFANMWEHCLAVFSVQCTACGVRSLGSITSLSAGNAFMDSSSPCVPSFSKTKPLEKPREDGILSGTFSTQECVHKGWSLIYSLIGDIPMYSSVYMLLYLYRPILLPLYYSGKSIGESVRCAIMRKN